LSSAQISAALKRARRRDTAARTAAVQAALRSQQLGQPAVVTAAYAATVRELIALLITLNEQVKPCKGRWRPILAGTRTLRSSCPSPDSV